MARDRQFAHCFVRSIVASILIVSVATAATRNWNAGDGDWSVPANWTPAGVPLAGDPVQVAFTDGIARTVTLDASTPSLGLVSLDLTGSGTADSTLSITSNNSITAAALSVGGFNGSVFTNGRGAVVQSAGTTTISPGVDLIMAWGSGSRGSYTLSGGTIVANQGVWVGYSGTGTFNHSGGTHTVNASTFGGYWVGANAGATGTYNLSGTGSLTSNEHEYIGYSGSGSFVQTGGTNTISAGNDLYLGYNAGGVGQYNISGGTLSVGNNLVVGNSGTGTLSIQDNASVHVANSLSINSSSTVNLNGGMLRFNTVDGTGGVSRINYTAGTIKMYAAGFSHPTITGLFGATPTIPAGKSLVLELAGFISNGGSLVINGGQFSTESLIIDPLHGMSITAGSAHIGDDFVNTGFVTVSGPESLMHVDGSLTVQTSANFNSPDAILTISSGATVFIAGDLHISHPGFNFPPTSAVNLNGGTLRFDGYTRDAAFGAQFNYSAGTIQLAGNRTIGADATMTELFGVSPTIVSGKGLTVEGTATLGSTPLTLAGGTFKAGTTAMMPGSTLRTTQTSQVVGPVVTLAGSMVDAAGGDLVIGDATKVNGFYGNGTLQAGPRTVTLADANDAVLDSGALVTLGSGASPGTLNAANGLTLDFGGNISGFGTVSTPNNITKPLINNGHITGTSAAQRITLPGYVKGVGTFDNVNVTGTFSPGLSPTSLQVGNVNFSPTSTLVIELGGTTPGSGYDQLQSTGAVVLGGTLQISLIDGFVPAAGQTFELFDAANLSGSFSSVVVPSVPGLTWDTTQLASGMLSAVPGLPGDYNNNGTVDAADYVVWRNGGSPDSTLAGYNLWKANFGKTSGSGSAVNGFGAAVPEPGSLLLLIVAVASCLSHRGRK